MALLALAPLAALAQSSIPETPEFGRILNQVLNSAKPFPQLLFQGLTYSKQLYLPGAGYCTLNWFAYRCEWEARPNKYSVAVLQNSLASRVGEALPGSWARAWENSETERTASFSDPAHHIRVLLTAPVSQSDTVLSSYTVALVVMRTPTNAKPLNAEEHLRSGLALAAQHDYQAAANEFRAAVSSDLIPAWVAVRTHVELGKIFDLTGQRDRAVNEYRQAKDLGDDTGEAQAEASRYLVTPYSGTR